jgi:hypothetical protein
MGSTLLNIPVFVSKSHGDKLSYIISKVVERMNAVNYYSIFSEAAEEELNLIAKIHGPKKGLIDKITKPFTEADSGSETLPDSFFYSSLSVEPTLLKFHNVRRDIGLSVTSYILIKAYCIVVDDVTDTLRTLASLSSGESIIRSLLRPVSNYFSDTSTKMLKQIKDTHFYKGLTRPKDLAESLLNNESIYWSYAISLLTSDISDEDISRIHDSYARMTKYKWGDFVITDLLKDVIIYCDTRSASCSIRGFKAVRASIMNKDESELDDITSSRTSTSSSLFFKGSSKTFSDKSLYPVLKNLFL